MAEQQHTMSLHEYIALIRGEPCPPSLRLAEQPIVITPALADALDALLEAADAAVAGGPLADALAAVRRLHDTRAVRLGGRPG